MAQGRFDPNQYVSVAERVDKFRAAFPEGRIETEILPSDDKRLVVRAMAWRTAAELAPAATGHAEEFRTEESALMKCETAAVGRALAFLGFEAKKGIASREEMERADRNIPEQKLPQAGPVPSPAPARPAEPVKAEQCGYCSADLTVSPTSNWLAAKRAKDPAFPAVCPTCFRKNVQNPQPALN